MVRMEESMAVDKWFGPDPGVEHLLSFDPRLEVAAPLAGETLAGDLDAQVQTKAAEIGLDADVLRLWRELGYVPTEQSRDSFSATEMDAWQDAVERQWAEESDVDDEGVDMARLLGLLADELESAVASTLAARSPEPARRFAERVMETDLLV